MNETTDDFDLGPPSPPVRLSAAGLLRRREMLRTLSGAVVTRRRRRAIVRAGTALAAAALVLVATVALLRSVNETPPNPHSPPIVRTEPVLPPIDGLRIEFVATDPALLARASISTDLAIAERTQIDDGALVDLIEAAGHSTGLVRFGDRVVLTGLAADDSTEHTPIDGRREERPGI